ncbi:MAG TPA: TetR/AcrR family transcriptional regulator [Nocardioidaceae bacterium]|nr:TetR/AcrR family transcriptional regulator [Nocardioidaceae bacterium]
MRPRTIRDDELLDLLLGAFADLGYDGTSVRALCRHLGVSHNMVHQRYQSKQAAWNAAVDHGFTELVASLNEPIDSHDNWEVLRALMTRFAEATLAKPGLARIIQMEGALAGPRFTYLMKHHIGPVQARTTAVLEELQADGLAKPGPIDLVWFFGVAWGVGGLASATRLADGAGRSDDLRDATMMLIEVLLEGLHA